MRVTRYNIINLYRERWAANASQYRDAVKISDDLEIVTGQLHGIERC